MINDHIGGPYRDLGPQAAQVEPPLPRIRQIIQSASAEMSTDISDVDMTDVWDDVIVLVIRTAAKHASDEVDAARLLRLATEAIDALQRIRDDVVFNVIVDSENGDGQ